jgi:hypothetical protein
MRESYSKRQYVNKKSWVMGKVPLGKTITTRNTKEIVGKKAVSFILVVLLYSNKKLSLFPSRISLGYSTVFNYLSSL